MARIHLSNGSTIDTVDEADVTADAVQQALGTDNLLHVDDTSGAHPRREPSPDRRRDSAAGQAAADASRREGTMSL